MLMIFPLWPEGPLSFACARRGMKAEATKKLAVTFVRYAEEVSREKNEDQISISTETRLTLLPLVDIIPKQPISECYWPVLG
jgi:hypothetical protein